MGVGAGLYMYDVVVKSSRSLSHLLLSFLYAFSYVVFGLVGWDISRISSFCT